MTNISETPELRVALLATAVMGVLLLYRLFLWVREAPVTPDPWDTEIEKQIHESDATVICHKCLTPQPHGQWFCEHCGSAVGDYNNVMPYLPAFSEGEVFRNGVTEKVRVNALTIIGYLLYSVACYFVFAPIYWFFFFKNLKRIKEEASASNPVSDTV